MPNYNCCTTCGVIFETETGYRDYCDSCRPVLRHKPRACKSCGTVIESPAKRQKYCPGCADFRKRRYRTERYQAIKARAAANKHAERSKHTGLTIAEAVRQATRMGISYGQFMDKYGR